MLLPLLLLLLLLPLQAKGLRTRSSAGMTTLLARQTSGRGDRSICSCGASNSDNSRYSLPIESRFAEDT